MSSNKDVPLAVAKSGSLIFWEFIISWANRAVCNCRELQDDTCELKNKHSQVNDHNWTLFFRVHKKYDSIILDNIKRLTLYTVTLSYPNWGPYSKDVCEKAKGDFGLVFGHKRFPKTILIPKIILKTWHSSTWNKKKMKFHIQHTNDLKLLFPILILFRVVVIRKLPSFKVWQRP